MGITVNQNWSADQKKNLQRMLNQYGFTDENGNALAVDGVIGPKTQQALVKMNTYQQHLTKPDESTKAWQAQLKDWGYKNADGMPLKVDGVYGPKTDAASNSFENSLFDGLTDGKSQKKTVPTQTFPNMPKTSSSQIEAAITPSNSNPTGYDQWGQSHAYTSKTVLQQAQNPIVAAAQNTNNAGYTSQSMLDMLANMNKLMDKSIADNTKLPDAKDTVYRFDQNHGMENTNKTLFQPFDEMVYKARGSGQDKNYRDTYEPVAKNMSTNSENNTGNMVDPVSHFPQGYNSWTSEQQKNVDPVGTYYIGNGDKAVKGNVYANDVTAPITFDGNNKPSNFGKAGYDHDINSICSMFDYMDYSLDEKKRWSKNYCDCSSYVIRVYSALGKKITDDDTTAAGIAKWLDDKGQRINKEDLQVGDLIFWAKNGDNGRFNNISHVAIFAGYNEKGEAMMWESSPSGGGVNLRPVLDQLEPLQYARVS